MDMKNLSVMELSDLTASKSAAPGGGSISALAGAFAASLVCMVAKLTEGKKGYEAVSLRMKELETQSEALRLNLLDDIQRDSSSFDAFMEALAMPKTTEEEKAARTGAMQDALKGACRIPRQVAEKALEVLSLAVEAVSKGNANATSDGLVGAFLARAAVLGALSNVRINLAGIKDQGFVDKLIVECDDMEQKARAAEKDVDLLMREKTAGAS
jgi:formiminotetrahydrofolate cyclodeaminase